MPSHSKLQVVAIPFSILLTACPRDSTDSDDEVGDTGSETSSSSGTDDDASDTESIDDTGDTETDTSDTETDTGDADCGNGIVEGDEECDDGNTSNNDACTNYCTAAVCGDGIIQEGEGCDAGADNGPGQPCNSTCQPNVCGDGELGPGEACDDGNMVDDDECGNDCALATCGNGEVDVGEACDDGNANDQDACLNTCVSASCGDGVLYPDEETCDLGGLNSDTAECTAGCEMAACGDGLIWFDVEECDLGPDNGPMSACLDDCAINVCGDGFVGPQEACDDGNLDDDDGCSAACEIEGCGDGIVQGSEECDDGNAVRTDQCTTACLLPACGDGFLHAGEECDDGVANANTADCTLSCTIAECGDGFVQAGVEQCDQGNANADNAACKLDCTDNVCGDGHPGPGEGCDDGNASNNDACTNVCTMASCGDGFSQRGEECDDGNGMNADGCTNACTLPACGDDIVQMGEECDDGIANGNNAACTPECNDAVCGDGLEYTMGGEQCDDGNLLDNDGCSSVCADQSILQVSGGEQHTCAVLQGGAVRCWGDGNDGRLGYGNQTDIGDNEHPYTAGNVDVGGAVAQISAGSFHTCAVLANGAVRCWGSSTYGQLGYGNTFPVGDNETPASQGDVPLGGPAVQVSAGYNHTCAVMTTGAVRCWGSGEGGKLGYGNLNNIGDNESPASAGNVNVGGLVAKVIAGRNHTCALLQNGAVRCWGFPQTGVLGYGNQAIIGDNESPASAGNVNIGGTAIDLDTSFDHTCAVLQGGEVKCWGAGQAILGYGGLDNIGDNETPASVGYVIVGNPALKISLGFQHSCALLNTGAIRCWGTAGSRLGYGNNIAIGDNETPASAGPVSLGGNVVQFEAGWNHTCAILESGVVRCWGVASDGKLGYANFNNIGDNELPSSVGPVQIY